jgi:homoprotocatechuate degradation regulator HpaR
VTFPADSNLGILMSNKKDGDNLLPKDTGRSLPMSLLRAREVVMEQFRPLLAKHNITEQQWRVLRVLAETNEMDASQVASRACILAPSLTRIIRKLQSTGLIKNRKDKNDGRRVLLSLEAKGRALIEQVSPESKKIYAGIESAFGQEEISRLLDVLDALQKSLKQKL